VKFKCFANLVVQQHTAYLFSTLYDMDSTEQIISKIIIYIHMFC